jgi:hypothetical protein
VRCLTFILAIACAAPAWAGDYWLVVQDTPGVCGPVARVPSTKVLTAQQVIDELERSFREPGHGLWGHFSNNRVSYCSDSELDKVESGLIAIGRWERLTDGRKWRDLILYRATARMLDKLDLALAAGSLPKDAKIRLQEARGAVSRTLADAAGGTKGLDKPEGIRRHDLGPSETTKGMVTLTCMVFPTVAVVEHNDPGLRGTDIKIRKREKGTSLDALCAPDYQGPSIQIPLVDNALEGVAGNFVLVGSADGFGGARGLWVYDLKATKVFEGTYNYTKPLTVTKVSGDVVLRYWAPLEKIPCWPAEQGCWPRILAANGVQDRLRPSTHACVVPWGEMKGDPSRALQIFAPAEVSLGHPTVRFVEGEANCDIAP